jgi:hypothetical protein
LFEARLEVIKAKSRNKSIASYLKRDIGTRKYFEIEFLNGYSIQIPYPDNLEKLPDAIKSELLLEISLTRRQIDNINFYVKDYIEEIERILKKIV